MENPGRDVWRGHMLSFPFYVFQVYRGSKEEKTEKHYDKHVSLGGSETFHSSRKEEEAIGYWFL